MPSYIHNHTYTHIHTHTVKHTQTIIHTLNFERYFSKFNQVRTCQVFQELITYLINVIILIQVCKLCLSAVYVLLTYNEALITG